MTPEEAKMRQDRYRGYMAEDYGIQSVGGMQPGVENQVANALAYMAFQLGQINRNVARLVDHLDKQAK